MLTPSLSLIFMSSDGSLAILESSHFPFPRTHVIQTRKKCRPPKTLLRVVFKKVRQYTTVSPLSLDMQTNFQGSFCKMAHVPVIWPSQRTNFSLSLLHSFQMSVQGRPFRIFCSDFTYAVLFLKKKIVNEVGIGIGGWGGWSPGSIRSRPVDDKIKPPCRAPGV